MSKDWAFKRHIRINEGQIRKVPKQSKPPPIVKGEKKQAEEFGPQLLAQIEEAASYCRRPEKIVGDEDFVFTVRTAGKVSFGEKALDRLGMNLCFQKDDYTAVVSLSPEMLDALRGLVTRYSKTAELRSAINEIASVSPADFKRTSPEVSEWIERGEEEQFVEIELLPNLGEENYASLMNSLFALLKESNCKFTPSRVREHGASIRAKIKPQTAKAIAQGIDSVWQARFAPNIVLARPQSASFKGNPTPIPPELNAKPVCILDTGIDEAHPYLKDIIITAVDLTSEGQSQDADGHGTFVSGLAAYGELERNSDSAATARIISVKILGKDAEIERPYLETRVEEAIERFHDSAKIFSMSVMYLQPCNPSHASELAYTIDRLSCKYDILFVICTGNLLCETEQSNLKTLPYPQYLSEKCCMVYEGADGASCVTVGGIANKETYRSEAKINQPSPFTRRGDTNGRGKPDVVSWAGNAEREPATGGLVSDERLGVISLGLSSQSLFAWEYGTSCAAPLVANQLAKLQVEYPEASANLLKALMVHFASVPSEHQRLNIGEGLKSALYGKGLPDFYKMAYSTKSCATFIVEDTIMPNEIAQIPIYIPKIMKKIYGEKILRATLVYNPPVDRSVAGYTLLDLDFKLYKNCPPSEEPKVQSHWDSAYRRPWDNVKTDTFRWQKLGWGEEWIIKVFPKLRFKSKTAELNESGQNYALVVTLEDPKSKVDIYNAVLNERKKVTQTLQAYIQSKKTRLQKVSP